jgi:hypothetical protein
MLYSLSHLTPRVLHALCILPSFVLSNLYSTPNVQSGPEGPERIKDLIKKITMHGKNVTYFVR